MIAGDDLDAWVEPRYLDAGVVEACRAAFERHPARLLVLETFLLDTVAAEISHFLSAGSTYRSTFGLYSVEHTRVPETEWSAAEDTDRLYRFESLAAARPEFRLSPGAVRFVKLRAAFRDGRFTTLFEGVSGLRLGGVLQNVHAMRVGDFLRVHDDEVHNRRAAFVLYLSPDWRPEFGGALRLIDRDKTEWRVEPRYNSLVLFDVTAGNEHYIEPIEAIAGARARVSFGGWLLAR